MNSDPQSDLGKQRRGKNIKKLQQDILANPNLAQDLQGQEQSVIRYEAITNQEQADQYIRDLEVDDLPDIMDNREKSLHLFGFYNFLEEQKEAEFYLDNFVKVFQLAIFYDDNYVYRYYLAKMYFEKGEREKAREQMQVVTEKIKSKEVSLYSSLSRVVNAALLRNQINELLIKLALPTLDT